MGLSQSSQNLGWGLPELVAEEVFDEPDRFVVVGKNVGGLVLNKTKVNGVP